MMMKWLMMLSVLFISSPMWGEDVIHLVPTKKQFRADEVVTLQVKFEVRSSEVWDTYLYFTDSRGTPIYVTTDGNSLQPMPLGMLPPQIQLRPTAWSKEENVRLHVALCLSETQDVFTSTHTTIKIVGTSGANNGQLPAGAQLLLVQDVDNTPRDRYSDYKQFDSRWKSEKMGQYDGTTIGSSGCAISSVGNLRGVTPSTMNSELKSDGGYSGNAIIWSKARDLSYKGSGSISDSLFDDYHVIADVGGHFVVLTGVAGSGQYYSKDPGKSSNPIYSKDQVYSVRLYYR